MLILLSTSAFTYQALLPIKDELVHMFFICSWCYIDRMELNNYFVYKMVAAFIVSHLLTLLEYVAGVILIGWS